MGKQPDYSLIGPQLEGMIADLEAEVAALRQEVAAMEFLLHEAEVGGEQVDAEIAALQAQVAELQRAFQDCEACERHDPSHECPEHTMQGAYVGCGNWRAKALRAAGLEAPDANLR